jgi:hypothetical protein
MIRTSDLFCQYFWLEIWPDLARDSGGWFEMVEAVMVGWNRVLCG